MFNFEFFRILDVFFFNLTRTKMFEHSLINLVNFPFHVMSSALAVWNENDFKRYIFPDLKFTNIEKVLET